MKEWRYFTTTWLRDPVVMTDRWYDGEASALAIQCVFRGWIGRQKMRKQRRMDRLRAWKESEEMYEEDVLSRKANDRFNRAALAVLRLQCQFRGNIARARRNLIVRKMKRRALEEQAKVKILSMEIMLLRSQIRELRGEPRHPARDFWPHVERLQRAEHSNSALLRHRVAAGQQNGKVLRDFSPENMLDDKKAAAEDIRNEGRELKRDAELVEHDVWEAIDDINSAARNAKERASSRLARSQEALAYSSRTMLRYRQELDADRDFLGRACFPVPVVDLGGGGGGGGGAAGGGAGGGDDGHGVGAAILAPPTLPSPSLAPPPLASSSPSTATAESKDETIKGIVGVEGREVKLNQEGNPANIKDAHKLAEKLGMGLKLWRTTCTRKMLEEQLSQVAARVVQALCRGKLARREMRKRWKFSREEEHLKSWALTKVQAVARRLLVRLHRWQEITAVNSQADSKDRAKAKEALKHRR